MEPIYCDNQCDNWRDNWRDTQLRDSFRDSFHTHANYNYTIIIYYHHLLSSFIKILALSFIIIYNF